MAQSQGLATKRPLVPRRQCLAEAQVPRSLGFHALEALPMAFGAQGWQRCVLRSPPSDALLPRVGAVAHCRNRLAVCNGVPRCSGRGASSIACGGRRSGGNQGPYPLGGLGPQYVPFKGRASAPSRVPPPGLARGSIGPPPPLHQKTLAGGAHPDGQEPPALPRDHHHLPQITRPPPPPPDPGEGAGHSLLSTPLIVPGLGEGGWSTGMALGGQDPLSPSGPSSGPRRPILSSRVAVGRECTRGSGRLHARCSKRGRGPLEWWAVPCVYRRARVARRHEATDTGLAYARVSHAHGHHHTMARQWGGGGDGMCRVRACRAEHRPSDLCVCRVRVGDVVRHVGSHGGVAPGPGVGLSVTLGGGGGH